VIFDVGLEEFWEAAIARLLGETGSIVHNCAAVLTPCQKAAQGIKKNDGFFLPEFGYAAFCRSKNCMEN